MRSQVSGGTAPVITPLAAAMINEGQPLTVSVQAVDADGTHVGALFGLAFSETPVRSFADAAAADHDRYGRFFHAMLDQGIYLAPSGYEAGFLTLAHGDGEIDQLLQAARRAFKKVA